MNSVPPPFVLIVGSDSPSSDSIGAFGAYPSGVGVDVTSCRPVVESRSIRACPQMRRNVRPIFLVVAVHRHLSRRWDYCTNDADNR